MNDPLKWLHLQGPNWEYVNDSDIKFVVIKGTKTMSLTTLYDVFEGCAIKLW